MMIREQAIFNFRSDVDHFWMSGSQRTWTAGSSSSTDLLERQDSFKTEFIDEGAGAVECEAQSVP